MNEELEFTLDEAVEEVLNLLTGLDLAYSPEFDRYRSIARALNRALRFNALEKEWSWYASVQSVGNAVAGQRDVALPSSVRPRIINDDAVRLVDANGNALRWAYFLPRDAMHKYTARAGLWCSVTRNILSFSRCFSEGEGGLEIQVPVMREPMMFVLPDPPEDPNDTEVVVIPASVRNQPIDFAYPDVIVARAAYLYAQTDPIMQPRVQTLEGQYKDIMYQVIERDERNTDSPFLNDFTVPIQNGLGGPTAMMGHIHPHADERS